MINALFMVSVTLLSYARKKKKPDLYWRQVENREQRASTEYFRKNSTNFCQQIVQKLPTGKMNC